MSMFRRQTASCGLVSRDYATPDFRYAVIGARLVREDPVAPDQLPAARMVLYELWAKALRVSGATKIIRRDLRLALSNKTDAQVQARRKELGARWKRGG